MHTAQGVPEHFSANDMSDVSPENIASLALAEQAEDCIIWESSPGHIDGDALFYA